MTGIGRPLETTDQTKPLGETNRPVRHYLRWQWLKEYMGFRIGILGSEWTMWKSALLMHIPGRLGSRIRVAGAGFKRRGQHIRIGEMVSLKFPERISLGHHVRLNTMAYLDGSGGITIGDHVGIGPGAQIYSINHVYQAVDRLYEEQGYEFGEVIIEDDVWVGGGAVILAGVKVGRGSVVAAGAVVTKDTEPYSVVAGVPARVVRRREDRRQSS